MAQRSRRKAVDLSEDEESFVKLGTPLPPLTSTKADKNVFVPIWKQEVTDEQGRRRLHGAFTGGFSAGYFNTVGSKEGWTPATFKSSRTDKKSQDKGGNIRSQRPEDFMDEEDLAELSNLETKDQELNIPQASSFGLGALNDTEDYDQHVYGSISDQVTSDPRARRKIPQGSSFGLGALNDTEDDDQDVYGSISDQVTSDPRARRLLNLSEENPRRKPVVPSAKASDLHVDQGAKVFEDNTNLPKGFRLSVTPNTNLPSTSYAPSKVPETWKPCPKQIWQAAARSSEPSGIQPNLRHLNRPVNADDRARLIGEQAPPRSILDFISAKDKARLEDAKQLAQASSRSKMLNQESSHQDKPTPEASIVIPKLDPSIAKSALRGFIPFSHDPQKQERYKLYLQFQAGILPSGTRFAPKVTGDLTSEVINKELDGFAKSAMMFKPMSAMMASRFTTAASSSAGGELAAPEPGLRQPVFLDDEKPEQSEIPKEAEESKEPVSQADQAVRIDMFGMLTRSIKEFYPQKLLCKRFNVPNPFPDGPPTDSTTTKSTSKNLTEFLASRGFQPAPSSDTSKTKDDTMEQENAWLSKENDVETTPTKVQPIHQVGLGGDETQGRDILTSSRPPIDLFKAIFANDDTDDEKGDDLASNTDEFPIPTITNPPITSTKLDNSKNNLDITKVVNNNQQVISLTPVVVNPQAVENLTSFRPTFSKKSRLKEVDEDEEEATNNNNDKKGTSKKKKKKRVLMSFEEEEQVDEETAVGATQETKKKKKKKWLHDESTKHKKPQDNNNNNKTSRKVEKDVEDQDDWVETTVGPPPPPSIPSKNHPTANASKPHPKFHRMKASDLMD